MNSRALAALCAATLISCDEPGHTPDGDEADTHTTSESRSYSGPGSYWTVDFDDGTATFHIEMSPNVGNPIYMALDGTFAVHDGWTVLTITEADDVEGAPVAGDQAIGIEIPGFAFMMKPLDESYNTVIPMLVSGSCPTADEELNWMVAQGLAGKDASSTEDDFFGTYRYQYADHSAEVLTRHALESYALLAEPAHAIFPEPCEGSVMTLHTDYTVEAGLPPVNLWMVPGGAMVETFHRDQEGDPVEKQTMLALHAEAISMDDIAGQTFIGLHVAAPAEDATTTTSGDAALGDILEVEVAFDAEGIATSTVITDIATDTREESGVTLTVDAINVPSDGFFTATLSDGPSSQSSVACAVATDMGVSGQTMMTCIGQDLDDTSRSFTLTLASQP
ncbi:MAG: hypothetical protein ACI8S6_004716 [Myxococcota bacterium]|jgi:hypothetical protein